MLGTPIVWFVAAALACGGAWFGAYAIKKNVQIADARKEGIAIGTGNAATTTLEAAAKTADAERLAEAEIPVSADLAYYRRLCAQQASCRSKGKYK